MKFLHCADVHLDSPLRGLSRYEDAPVDDIRGATRRAFENVVDLALYEQVACVVIAGDLYDGDRDDFNTAIFLQRQLHRLADAHIPVAIVLGNHDAASQITKRLEFPENTHRFAHKAAETHRIEGAGIALHGRSYATRVVTDDIAADYPAPEPGVLNIGVLHTALDGRPGHDPYAPCTEEGLARHDYAYWALGHVHERDVMTAHGSTIVFPGNTQGRHAREAGPKGATLVEYDGDRVMGVEHRVLDVVRWIRVDVDASSCDTVSDIAGVALEQITAAAAAADDRTCAVRVSITGVCAAHDELMTGADTLRAQLRGDMAGFGGQVWIEKIASRTTPFVAPVDDASLGEARAAIRTTIASLAGNDAALGALLESIRPLRNKLGNDIQAFVDQAEIDLSADGIRALLPEIETLLVAELRGSVA